MLTDGHAPWAGEFSAAADRGGVAAAADALSLTPSAVSQLVRLEREASVAWSTGRDGRRDVMFAEVVDTHGTADDAPAEADAPPDPVGLRTTMAVEDAYRIAVPAGWPVLGWLEELLSAIRPGADALDVVVRHL